MVDKIGRRYAEAIYEIATEEQKVLEIHELLQDVENLYINNIDFREFLHQPLIKKEEKLAMIEKIFASAEELEQNIVLYIVDKGRISDIKDIALEYKAMYYKANNIIDVKATFADEMSEEQKKKLIEKLETKTNKKVNLEVAVDKSLIGGGILKIGDKIIDGSIKAQLSSMAKAK